MCCVVCGALCCELSRPSNPLVMAPLPRRYMRQFSQAVTILSRPSLANSSEARSLRANLNQLLGRFDDAEADLEALLVQYADRPAVRHTLWETQKSVVKAKRLQGLGLTAHALGNYVDASHAFTEAMKVAKHSSFLHLLRADCGLRLDNYMLVRHDATMVLQQDPSSARALALLGRALFDIVGKVDAATSNLRHCLRYNSPGRKDVRPGCNAAL